MLEDVKEEVAPKLAAFFDTYGKVKVTKCPKLEAERECVLNQDEREGNLGEGEVAPILPSLRGCAAKDMDVKIVIYLVILLTPVTYVSSPMNIRIVMYFFSLYTIPIRTRGNCKTSPDRLSRITFPPPLMILSRLLTFFNKRQLSANARRTKTLGDRVSQSSTVKKLIHKPRNDNSPAISRIPLEILSVIFLICSSESDPYPTPGTLAIEVNLSHVSRKWRIAALITPRLWSRQSVRWSTSPDRIDQYLTRSKLAPLELHLLFDMLSGRSKSFPSNFLKICGVADRWEGLFVRVMEFHIWGRFASRFPTSFPSLKTLSVYFHKEHHLWGPLNPYDAFPNGAPLLSSIAVSHICLSFSLPPLASVTHFTIGRDALPPATDFDLFCHVIEGFPNLLYLSIHSDITSSDIAKGFTLPSLQTLVIVNSRALAILLLNIVAPMLNRLVLKDVYVFTILSAVNPVTFPSITSLSIEADVAHGDYVLQDWIQVARVFPAITHLELVETGYPTLQNESIWFKWTPLLYALTIFDGDTVAEFPNQFSFWSNLTSISYQGRVTSKMLIDLLNARAEKRMPIQLLRVSHDLHSQLTNDNTWELLHKLVRMEVFEPEQIM